MASEDEDQDSIDEQNLLLETHPSFIANAALDAIARSCLVAHDSAIAWAQWCRAVAIAGSHGDCVELDHLLAQQRRAATQPC